MIKQTLFSFLLCYSFSMAMAQGYEVKNDSVFYNDIHIKNADSNTFKEIHSYYLPFAKDTNHVYYKHLKTYYDANTFEVHNKRYISDKNDDYVYHFQAKHFMPLKSKSPKSYEYHSQNINIDNNYVYWLRQKLFNSHAKTLKVLSSDFFQDKNNMYCDEKTLPLDLNNLTFFKNKYDKIVSIGDGSRVCTNSGYCHNLNTNTFTYINTNYVKDNNRVLYKDRPVIADAKSFHVPNPEIEDYAKDKHHDFYLDNTFPERIPETHIINEDSIRHYYEWVDKQLETAFLELEIPKKNEKKPEHKLEEIYTFTASNNTKIKKGNYIYMNNELLPFIDANSFVILNNDYAKDKNNVYLIYEYKDHVTFNEIEGIDVNSFEIIKEDNNYASYCKDSKNVFWRLDKIEDADPDSFKIFNEDFSYDKNTIFFVISKIAFLKTEKTIDIELIDRNYYRYNNYVFHIGNIDDKDNAPITLAKDYKVINFSYFLNGKDILYRGKVVGQLEDGETIIDSYFDSITTSKYKNYYRGQFIDSKNKDWLTEYVDISYLTNGGNLFTNNLKEIPYTPVNQVYSSGKNYMLFKNGKALLGHTTFDLDINTAEEIGYSGYIKDKDHVYLGDEITPYDTKSFKYYTKNFTSDKHGVYYNDILIKEGDLATFNKFNNYGFDKNNFYFEDKIIPRSKVNLKK